MAVSQLQLGHEVFADQAIAPKSHTGALRIERASEIVALVLIILAVNFLQ